MGSPYVGEIRMFGGNFAPAGWAFCNGAVIAITENETLFNLIGTTYGGDGQSTFQLPDLQGRVPIHMGTRDSITYTIGETGGVESVTLTTNQMPAHTHPPLAGDPSTSTSPASAFWGKSSDVAAYENTTLPPTSPMRAGLIQNSGGSQPHDNMLPYLVVSFVISLFGVFPTQN